MKSTYATTSRSTTVSLPAYSTHCVSVLFHFFKMRDLVVTRMVRTVRVSFVFSCSTTDERRQSLCRHLRSSESGLE